MMEALRKIRSDKHNIRLFSNLSPDFKNMDPKKKKKKKILIIITLHITRSERGSKIVEANFFLC